MATAGGCSSLACAKRSYFKKPVTCKASSISCEDETSFACTAASGQNTLTDRTCPCAGSPSRYMPSRRIESAMSAAAITRKRATPFAMLFRFFAQPRLLSCGFGRSARRLGPLFGASFTLFSPLARLSPSKRPNRAEQRALCQKRHPQIDTSTDAFDAYSVFFARNCFAFQLCLGLVPFTMIWNFCFQRKPNLVHGRMLFLFRVYCAAGFPCGASNLNRVLLGTFSLFEQDLCKYLPQNGWFFAFFLAFDSIPVGIYFTQPFASTILIWLCPSHHKRSRWGRISKTVSA